MNRRDVLKATVGAAGAGLTLATTLGKGFIGPALAASSPADAMSTEQKLAAFAASIHYTELPDDVVRAAKNALLDSLGCAFGAVGSEPADISERTIRSTYGDGAAATIIGYPRQATLEGAAFVNGVLVRTLDLNDTYLGTDPLHPSEVLPAALALCEERSRSGRDLIEAIVAGYEAAARVNDAISFMERGFHPLCAAAYGIPLIAGKVWGLPDDVVAQAVGISAARGYTSFVVNSGAISMMKAMGLAATAVDGIFATRLAAGGFTGPSGTLEWFASKMKPVRENLSLDLELARFRVPRVAFKRFPVQIELQAVVEAGVLLAGAAGPRIADVRGITVETYPGIIERVADRSKFRPETKGTADHSLPVCLAMALLDGDVTPAKFEAGRWRDADVMALVDKISVKPGAALMAKRPKGRGVKVEIVLSDDRTLTETVEVAEGDAERPLSASSLAHKFMTFAAPVVGTDRAQRIKTIVDDLDGLADVRDLTRLLRTSP